MRILDIQIGNRRRKDMGDLDGLASSIAEIGLLHPVVVTPDGLLIAGRRRLEACKLLGLADIPTTVVNLNNIVRGEHDENAYRKDFTPSEMVAIAEALEPTERQAARERQEAGVRPSEKFTEGGEALVKVARAVGVSRPTLAKAKAIVEAAEQEPERFGDLVAQMDETGKVDRAYRDLRERQRRQEGASRISKCTSPDNAESHITVICGDMLDVMPGLGEFNTIIADSPYGVTEWPWDNWNSMGQYLAQCERWLEVLKEARAEQCHLFWFCSPRMAADVEMIFRKLDLPINSRLVWHRRNMALGSDAKDRFLDSWEMIFHSGNTSLNWPPSWDDGRFDVQTFAVPQTNYTDCKLHPTQKPLELMKWLLAYGSWPGARVLDPFAGAGTTGAACPEDRTCILIERDEEYADIIRHRLGL